MIGQGSTFTVALPYQMSTSTTRSAELITPFSLPTAKSKSAIAPLILLVEDNEANVQTFTSYLSAYEYRVILAKNGEEGVAIALTARAMQGDQELCIKAGANQYLSKPVELEQLVGVIGQFLEM